MSPEPDTPIDFAAAADAAPGDLLPALAALLLLLAADGEAGNAESADRPKRRRAKSPRRRAA